MLETNKFKLQSKFKPTGDQPTAIAKLEQGLSLGFRDQVLLGVTGSGKTFTMANIVQSQQRPTLVICHNKTLAAQLASEFQKFFPANAVHYFVSYYDYYQPEAYVPQSDTYIEKTTQINEEIDRLRHAATTALLTRRDVLIVASVSCIYGLGSVSDYNNLRIKLRVGEKRLREKILRQLTDIQYQRNDFELSRGNFQVKGDVLDIFPVEYNDRIVKIEFYGNEIEKISVVNSLTGEIIENLKEVEVFPAKHFVAPEERFKDSIGHIRQEMSEQVIKLKAQNKLIEAQRIEERTNFDLEMMETTGYCNGVENYSRYLTNREVGEPPATLIDYFPDDFLMFIDESHMTVPQIGGMSAGDRSRKQTLVDFGFRLPSALDNRPLNFNEFNRLINQVIYVSATPGPYELGLAGVKIMDNGSVKGVADREDLIKKIADPKAKIAEQVIRPTGLLDPEIEIRPTSKQVQDLEQEIIKTVESGSRVLVTTLTKRLAEDLADFLQEKNLKVQYLHSEVETLVRLEILRDLRLGKYDVLIGINLLREGLDLPEVSLVAILDADKEGFLRSESALIQTMGRAARHVYGRVIMYADNITGSMQRAIDEVKRRRQIQAEYNKKHKITPISTTREIEEIISLPEIEKEFQIPKVQKLSVSAKRQLTKSLQEKMLLAAENLEFEKAAEIRDLLNQLKKK